MVSVEQADQLSEIQNSLRLNYLSEWRVSGYVSDTALANQVSVAREAPIVLVVANDMPVCACVAEGSSRDYCHRGSLLGVAAYRTF